MDYGKGCTHKRIVFLFLFALVAIQPSLHAQFSVDPNSFLSTNRETGIRFGRWRLHAALNYYNGYDSNVLFLNVNPQSDYFFEVSPGADVILQGVKTSLLAGYRYRRTDFLEQNIQDYNAHSVFFKAQYQFSRRFMLKLDEQYERSSDPADDDIPERVGRSVNRASAEIAHQTPANDLQTSLKYTHIYQRFDTSLSGLSFFSNKVFVTSRINMSSRFRFLPKSTLLLNGEYGFTDFNNNGPPPQNYDSNGWSITTGLSSQFSRKLILLGQVGISSLYFKAGPDTFSMVGNFRAEYEFSQRLRADAGYQRRLEESQFTNFLKEHAADVHIKMSLSRKLDTGVRFKASFIEFSGPNVTVSGSERADKLYQVDYNLNYRLKPWLMPLLKYSYTFRDSNATSFFLNSQSADFSKHTASLGVELYY